jgi:hypothetical protein
MYGFGVHDVLWLAYEDKGVNICNVGFNPEHKDDDVNDVANKLIETLLSDNADVFMMNSKDSIISNSALYRHLSNCKKITLFSSLGEVV